MATDDKRGDKPPRKEPIIAERVLTTFAAFSLPLEAALANALRVHLGLKHDQIHEPIDEQKLADGLRTLTS